MNFKLVHTQTTQMRFEVLMAVTLRIMILTWDAIQFGTLSPTFQGIILPDQSSCPSTGKCCNLYTDLATFISLLYLTSGVGARGSVVG
jgi:hypothetical protein